MTPYFAYCRISISPVRAEASDGSEITTQLLFGEVISVLELNKPWAKIKTASDDYVGFIDFKHYHSLTDLEAKNWMDSSTYLKDRESQIHTPWGLQRICRGSYIHKDPKHFKIGNDEFSLTSSGIITFHSPVEYALDYINTPYLWGGKSPFGIDCSGITQIIYRLFGFELPRDASKQVLHGREIEFDEIEAGDLAFFENDKGKITHVGILDGEGHIIHASGHVRKDQLKEKGIIKVDTGVLSHKLKGVRRL